MTSSSTYFRKMLQNCSKYQVVMAARCKCIPLSKHVPLSAGHTSCEYGVGPEKLTKGACGTLFIKYA